MESLSNEGRCSRGKRCECGTLKNPRLSSCDRCMYLDGGTLRSMNGRPGAAKVDIISVLRCTDGMSLSEIAEETKRPARSILRALRQMLECGRVRRFWREEMNTYAGRPIASYRNGTSKMGTGAVAAWAYALDGKTELEWARAQQEHVYPSGYANSGRRLGPAGGQSSSSTDSHSARRKPGTGISK